MTHAKAFLSNARDLASVGGDVDFQIFGVLYGIRHGVELFLKCMVQNRLVDDALVLMIREKATLEEVVKWLGKDEHPATARSRHEQLLAVLSAVRNIEVDRIAAPECWIENQATKEDPTFALEGHRYIQSNGHLPRYTVGYIWVPAVKTHNLLSVFKRAEKDLGAMHRAVCGYAEHTTGSEVLPVSTIAATCELFELWDPNGHAIRYASSSGASSPVQAHGWNVHLPALSLEELGQLASDLDDTVEAYDNLLGECYAEAKLRSPHPSYVSFHY